LISVKYLSWEVRGIAVYTHAIQIIGTHRSVMLMRRSHEAMEGVEQCCRTYPMVTKHGNYPPRQALLPPPFFPMFGLYRKRVLHINQFNYRIPLNPKSRPSSRVECSFTCFPQKYQLFSYRKSQLLTHMSSTTSKAYKELTISPSMPSTPEMLRPCLPLPTYFYYLAVLHPKPHRTTSPVPQSSSGSSYYASWRPQK